MTTKGKNAPIAASGTVLVELPAAAPAPEDYQSRHIDINSLSMEQAIALAHVFHGLRRDKAQLKNERFVEGPTDAIRFILEQIYSELPR